MIDEASLLALKRMTTDLSQYAAVSVYVPGRGFVRVANPNPEKAARVANRAGQPWPAMRGARK